MDKNSNNGINKVDQTKQNEGFETSMEGHNPSSTNF